MSICEAKIMYDAANGEWWFVCIAENEALAREMGVSVLGIEPYFVGPSMREGTDTVIGEDNYEAIMRRSYNEFTKEYRRGYFKRDQYIEYGFDDFKWAPFVQYQTRAEKIAGVLS